MKNFTYKQGDRLWTVEIGEVGKQANGSCVTRFGDTTVLSAAVMGKTNSTADFFPLMVLYQEKLYAAGKIPGGFFKREGRPTDHETLTARLIDRPIRPLFGDDFRTEVQIVNTVLSSNPNNSSQMAALFSSSLALMISDIPFNGPVAGVIVGRVDGKLIINPSVEEVEKSDIYLTVAGTKDAINMVESSAKEVSEQEMLKALMFGFEEIKKLCAFQLEIQKAVGKPKQEVEKFLIPENIQALVTKEVEMSLKKAIVVKEKLARQEAIEKIETELLENLESDLKKRGLEPEERKEQEVYLKEAMERVIYKEFRRLVAEDKVRPDGRNTEEIRPLSSRVDYLERTHGSALFTRGQTQSLGVVTLGSLNEYQIIDGLGEEDSKRFIFHYNFPAFSVGETGRYGSPGRREVGHGALAEKALFQVIPSEDEFPYTIRVVSEILESNGSSSQASICSGCLALMAAGVPLKGMVAGIAMGLIQEGKKYTILTDIQGMEDHLGDMDFKVAGTRKGITALQMDIKIAGITEKILKEALDQAKKGRYEILTHMEKTLQKPRPEVSKYAPKVVSMMINPDKIKDVIGSGGKVINDIIDKCNKVKIDIEQTGKIYIMHQEKEYVLLAQKMIENLIREPEVGVIYTGKVVSTVEFGAFVELWPGTEGLCHISELSENRVKQTTDVVNVGDEIVVKVLGIDAKTGKIKLSRKEALKK